MEFSWPTGMPLVRPLGRGLWEVRSDITDGRIARVLFCVEGGWMGAAARVYQENAENAGRRS